MGKFGLCPVRNSINSLIISEVGKNELLTGSYWQILIIIIKQQRYLNLKRMNNGNFHDIKPILF